MSERERKSKGEPGRALPNLPKFLQGKPSPPPEKPVAAPEKSPAARSAPIIPPIEGAGPAAKKPKPPAPVQVKPNQAPLPRAKTPQASPPSAPAEKKPVAEQKPVQSSAPPPPVAKTPAASAKAQPVAPTPATKATEKPSKAAQPTERPIPKPAEARAPSDARPTEVASPLKQAQATRPTVAKTPPLPVLREPAASAVPPGPVAATPEASKHVPPEPKREQAPDPPVPAPVVASAVATPAEGGDSDRSDYESTLDDVLPQAVSVSIVREAMAAEKAYRPILFAGPLKRVPKATPAETNGSANGASHHHPSVAETTSLPLAAPSLSPPAEPAVAPALGRGLQTSTDGLGGLMSPARQEVVPAPVEARAASETSPTEASVDAPSEGERQESEPEKPLVEGEDASEPDAESVARDRRNSKRRKAVSSVLLAAANRAKAVSAADAEEHGEGVRTFADPWDRIRAASVAPIQADGPTIRTEQDLDEGEITPEKIVRRTPPFAVSLLLHVVVIVVLALIALPGFQSRTELELEMNYATEDSELMEAIELDLPSELEIDTTDPFAPDLSAMAADPLEAALETPPGFGEFDLSEPANAGMTGLPSVGFSSRGEGNKGALLGAFGGTVATQDAVKLGLGWMRRQQQPDGAWLMSGPYSNAALHPNKTAATAMALLCFFGDGHTPEEGEFRQTVSKGVDALLKLQNSDGDFYSGSEGWHQIYSQAQATIALCELYGMTKDERYRRPAERAVRYCILTQGADGGWPHYPGQDSDTSVTGWYLMALKSGEMAGIATPPDVFAKVSAFLDGVQDEGGLRYKRRALDKEATRMMTAEAVLCREYLGWERNDPRLESAVSYLLETPPNAGESEAYYWYSASQVMHHYGGSEWDAWNEQLREVLPALQEQKGREQGSWNPFTDEWGARGGRLYMTALCLYTLEIYYRHLPLYQKNGESSTGVKTGSR